MPDHLRRRRLRAGAWGATQVVTLAAAYLLGAPGGSPLWWALPVVGLLAWHPWMRDEGGVPVLMYHSVSADARWLPAAADLSVSLESFRAQLEHLDRNGFSVLTTEELTTLRQNDGPLPRLPVVLHFDDGYLDNWVAALPLLEEFGFPATFFVSLDFLDDREAVRPTLRDVAEGRCDASELRWDGYLTWAELATLAASPLTTVGSHGIDHGRVASGPRSIDTVTAENWRTYPWLQWSGMPGSKVDWYRGEAPPARPVGTPVPESGPSLSTRAWVGGELEPPGRLRERAADALRRSRRVLEARLETAVRFFCWPENSPHPDGRQLVAEAGYAAAGIGTAGENRVGEAPDLISRVHVGDSLLGRRLPALDNLAFHAKLRVHQGNYYWFLVLGPLHLLKRIARDR